MCFSVSGPQQVASVVRTPATNDLNWDETGKGYWWLMAVGSGWRLAVGRWLPLAVGDGWRLAVGGGWWRLAVGD